jgi:uncharacterized membrane protein
MSPTAPRGGTPPLNELGHQQRRFNTGGILLGIGLGGFVDGIVLHQLLQWHHMLTSTGDHPATTIAGLETNTLWDGLFHVSTWVAAVVGIFVLTSAMRAGYRAVARHQLGLLLMGWGAFNLVEGIVDHHILGIHHVRDDVGAPLGWDLAFLALGAALVLGGLALKRSGQQTTRDKLTRASPAG